MCSALASLIVISTLVSADQDLRTGVRMDIGDEQIYQLRDSATSERVRIVTIHSGYPGIIRSTMMLSFMWCL